VKEANRSVLISQPSKTAMQSGSYQTRYWKIEFADGGALEPSGRWENPLMGWISSADPLQAIDLHLRFESKEAAVAFAEKNGWDYSVKPTNIPSPTINRKYADNFKYEPGKLRLVKCK